MVSRPRTVPRAVTSASGSSWRSASAKFIAGSMCPAEWPPATTTRGAVTRPAVAAAKGRVPQLYPPSILFKDFLIPLTWLSYMMGKSK